MTTLARCFLIVATVLGLAACSDGKLLSGYDGDSPAADHTDWCGTSPPSGYCNTSGD